MRCLIYIIPDFVWFSKQCLVEDYVRSCKLLVIIKTTKQLYNNLEDIEEADYCKVFVFIIWVGLLAFEVVCFIRRNKLGNVQWESLRESKVNPLFRTH